MSKMELTELEMLRTEVKELRAAIKRGVEHDRQIVGIGSELSQCISILMKRLDALEEKTSLLCQIVNLLGKDRS